MDFTDAYSPSSSASAQDFKLAFKTRAESKVNVKGEVKVDNKEAGESD